MKQRWRSTPLLILALMAPRLLFAGTPSDPALFPAGQPIETQINLGLLGLVGGGMRYSVGGKPISRYEDFQTLIYSAHDEKATDLLRQAQDAHFTAWMFYVSGAAFGVDIALTFKPDPLLGVDWFDRIVTGFVAAQIFWAGGSLFDGNAEGQKYNAVQRYNHLLRGKDEAFLGFTPRVCRVGQGLGLDLGHAF